MTTTTLNQLNQSATVGDYTIYNNQWGNSTGTSYVSITAPQQNGLGANGVVLTNAFPNYQPTDLVWGYSEVYWGSLYTAINPITNTTVSNVKSLVLNFSTAIQSPSENQSDLLIELYTKNAAGQITNEISVMGYGWNTGNGKLVNLPGTSLQAYFSVSSDAAPGVGGISPTATHDVFRLTPDLLSGTIDFAPILQYLEQGGYVNPNDTVSGVELGTETIQGTNTLTVNSFNVFETVTTAHTNTEAATSNGQVFSITTNNNYVIDGGTHSGVSVAINSSALGFTYTTSSDGHLHLADTGYGALDLHNVGTVQFSDSSLAIGAGNALTLSTTSSAVAANLGALESIETSSGSHIAVTLTDAGIPTIKLTADQFNADTSALKTISGAFNTEIVAPTTSTNINGSVSGLGTTVDFADPSSKYTITTNADHSITVTEGSAVYHLSNVTALHFADTTDIVASQALTGSVTVSSAQVTNLYAAVFGRLPDVGGLAYYEQSATANPTIPITTYAQNFLSSPEYTGNSAHAYAQTEAGESQFITDTYSNLLKRVPEAGAVQWYETNVVDPMLKGLTAGTAAYAQADLQAHALVLTNFSQSAEFLGDVQVTAQSPSSSSHWLLLV